jgi:hypothetical protein
MGSGLSLNKQQVVHIIKRDLKFLFEENEALRCPYDQYGYIAYESFDDEEKYIKQIRQLNQLLEKLQ